MMTDTTPNQTTDKKTPDLYIYAKLPHGTATRIGSQIGCAFRHKDGVGMNILLDATPLTNPHSGRIELVAFPAKD